MPGAGDTPCPGCGWVGAGSDPGPPRFRASAGCWQAFGDLTGQTLAQPPGTFVHQTAVDAYAAQHCPATDLRMLVFALLGLHLVLDDGCTGRQVQRVHQALARLEHPLPQLDPLPCRGVGTAVAAAADAARLGVEPAVHAWAAAVWQAYAPAHATVREWSRGWPDVVWAAARR